MLTTTSRSCLAIAMAAIASFASSSDALANGRVRYVTINGDNLNNCLLATPCRTLQRGINATPVGGELRVLDSGSFGPAATITKSITISGAQPDVTLSQMALTVNAPGRVVALRGLHFLGGGIVPTGIFVDNATRLSIEDCTVQGYSQNGIFIDLFPGLVHIDRSVVRDNGSNGLFVPVGSALVSATALRGNAVAGIDVGEFGTARLSGNTITNNAIGLRHDGAVFTRLDNTIEDNSSANTTGNVALTTFSGR